MHSPSSLYRAALVFVLVSVGCTLQSACTTTTTPTGNNLEAQFKAQPFERPEACLPCHQRQYDELYSAVKSGYRSVSPLFNALETSGNLISGGLLRPVYGDSTIVLPDGTPLNTNMFTTPLFTETRQVQAGFCFSCHNADIELLGEDPSQREVPALNGLSDPSSPNYVAPGFQPTAIRPLRDYILVNANGQQVLPSQPGGLPPPGSFPSLGAAAITCDSCHDEAGPDLNRSFLHDGFANMSLLLKQTIEKVGPFPFPVAVKDDFHVASNNTAKVDYLKSSEFCAACHDVRIPNADLTAEENDINPGGQNVEYFRLENLSTEFKLGPYNTANNPFGKAVTCQDCHMSLFPYAGNKTYTVGDMTVTSPIPGIYPTDYAAVPGVSTPDNVSMPLRQVVTHYFTGVDLPLLPLSELRARLGSNYPDPYATGTDSHGIPLGLATRRVDLMKAAVRVDLDKTDPSATVGQSFMVRLEAVALTGHRFPSGFSQERTAYVELTVKDDNGFLLYQSGYVVDKPHPDDGETAPDGNLDDEDLEHIHVVVDPGHFTNPYQAGTGTNGGNNAVFGIGPDDGPDARVYEGAPEGLVLFRNELTHIFLPGQPVGRLDANGNPVISTGVHFEETFNAGLANDVDNFRSLPPLQPRVFNYEVELPTTAELQSLGVTLKGPLHIHAQVDFEHFPPLFLRYLAETTGPNGPAGQDLHLVNENLIDTLLKNVRDIASADATVNLVQ
jgi:hypothetical protein